MQRTLFLVDLSFHNSDAVIIELENRERTTVKLLADSDQHMQHFDEIVDGLEHENGDDAFRIHELAKQNRVHSFTHGQQRFDHSERGNNELRHDVPRSFVDFVNSSVILSNVCILLLVSAAGHRFPRRNFEQCHKVGYEKQ